MRRRLTRFGVFLSHRAVLALLVSLFVVEARLYTVKKFGVQEPFMDSFSEVHDYKATREHDYGKVLELSLARHNEHRVFLTRWTNVGLFLLNGEKWDLLLEACFNAVLAGLCVLAFFAGIGRYFDKASFLFFSAALLLVFGLPISYENILWGFQSQHFYFILFSIVSISFLPTAKPSSLLWWAGLLAGILACLTLGSGFYALLSVALVCGLMAFRRVYRTWSLAITAAVCLLVLAANVPGLIGMESDPQFKVHTARQFLSAFVLSLAWPNAHPFQAWSALIVHLPFLALACVAVFRKQPLPRSSYAILGLGIWSLLIIVTLSYLRGVYIPYARYYDYNAFNVILNAAAILEMLRLRLFPGLPGVVRNGFLVCWSTVILMGCSQLADAAWYYKLPERKYELRQEQLAVREFFASGDANILKSPALHGVFPFTERYNQYNSLVLRDPEIYRSLPNAMKPELFAKDDSEPLSHFRQAFLRRSDYIMVALGILMLASAANSLYLLGFRFDRNTLRILANAIKS